MKVWVCEHLLLVAEFFVKRCNEVVESLIFLIFSDQVLKTLVECFQTLNGTLIFWSTSEIEEGEGERGREREGGREAGRVEERGEGERD